MKTANDNAPSSETVKQHGTNFALSPSNHVSKRAVQDNHPSSIPDLITNDELQEDQGLTTSLKLTLGCWLAALLLAIGTFSLNASTGPKVFASLSLLWTGMWASYVSADYGKWRVSELSVVTAMCGLLGTVIVSAAYFNVGLTITDGLILMSIIPLFVGFILKSRICVLASICASLIWGALNFSGVTEQSDIMFLFPAIWAAQIFIGTKIRSGMVITLAVLTAYYWAANIIFTHWSVGNLPLTFGTAAVFICGLAHHRAGKAAEDNLITGSSVHIYAGWLAAVIGAIGFQYFWLVPDAIATETASLSSNGLLIWKAIVSFALATVFCSAIIRYKFTQISLAGIFLLTAASALIPLMLWIPSWPQNLTAAIPGLSVVPTMGILIGSAIIASALGMMLNGVRRHAPVMIGMGLVMLFAEAALLYKPDLMTLDNAIIFTAGTLISLAIGAAIAGSSLAHQAPAPRLKHS
ncbi:hypothetical protein [Hellea balneolensis]|uniref:hypothetical protein n=1 Tax=Hellea balneolensis TaxID=287478 RepID=UPI00040A3D40|nr:hypothetical protein [Hellea balneolensis]